MERREIENLILKDEDLIVCGDLIITGNIQIENGNLIVSGALTITGEVNEISIIGGDVSVGKLFIDDLDVVDENVSFYMQDGDIFVAGDFHSEVDVTCDNIDVRGEIDCESLTCLSVTCGMNIDAADISATLDIYSKSIINAWGISARDVYTESYISLNNHSLNSRGSVYAEEGIICCSSFIQ